ncbi:hypothetical protein BS50DRAFT_680682 [Corynespora cassiicola Philippines]|uniref:Uncharacterized protein n=1 Tax=Corynespora cassiicola Philippines TaxID=1448308 RepID=A0A2T2N8P4_CORCC|nr:hypothetical protein BS50DRAFT_680682 [Corynespora cassiicola Philippines]
MTRSGPDDSAPSKSLRDEYSMRPVRVHYRLPGTFSRENPSYFLADIFWIVIAILHALIIASKQSRNLQSQFLIAISGDKGAVDFTQISPEAIIGYMEKHPGAVQHAIDSANEHVRFFASITEPLPAFIGNPSEITETVSWLLWFYLMMRFCSLHSEWRFNAIPIYLSYLPFFLLALWSSKPTSEIFMIVLGFCYPAFSFMSICVHKILGDRAWKPLILGIELTSKQKNGREVEGKEEEMRDLLNSGLKGVED